MLELDHEIGSVIDHNVGPGVFVPSHLENWTKRRSNTPNALTFRIRLAIVTAVFFQPLFIFLLRPPPYGFESRVSSVLKAWHSFIE
jgi:hypothetical protein